jgi:hypothetical protein
MGVLAGTGYDTGCNFRGHLLDPWNHTQYL